MGGLLAEPASNLPILFGPGAFFGFSWITGYPYALPSILNSLFLIVTTSIVFFGLEEVRWPASSVCQTFANFNKTLNDRRGKFDLGLDLNSRISAFFGRMPNIRSYSKLESAEPERIPMSAIKAMGSSSRDHVLSRRKLPFSRIWTRNVVFTLITVAFFDFQLGYVDGRSEHV